MVNSHCKFNFMPSIMVEGSWYVLMDDMKHAVQGFYSSLFSKPEPWRPKVDGLVFLLPSLTDSQRMDLEILLYEEEVQNSRVNVGDKAPGPHGMTTTFVQDNWDTLKVDVLRMLTEFDSTGKFVKNLDAIFIGLIPKELGAHNIRDYRLIRLVGCAYELLSKVLAAKLRGVIGSLIFDD